MRDKIEICLNCTKPDCDDCLSSRNVEKPKKRNKLYYVNDEGRSMKEWAEVLGIHYPTLSRRIRLGIKIDEMPETKEYLRTKECFA